MRHAVIVLALVLSACGGGAGNGLPPQSRPPGGGADPGGGTWAPDPWSPPRPDPVIPEYEATPTGAFGIRNGTPETFTGFTLTINGVEVDYATPIAPGALWVDSLGAVPVGAIGSVVAYGGVFAYGDLFSYDPSIGHDAVILDFGDKSLKP